MSAGRSYGSEMVSKTRIVHLYICTLNIVDIVGNTTHNKMLCYGQQLSTDPACNTSEKMYPKSFTTKTFKYDMTSSCQTRPYSLTGEPCKKCCQHHVDQNTTYELPSEAIKSLVTVSDKRYKDFVTQCIGRSTCQMNGNVDRDCVTFEYECVDDNQILNFTGNSMLNGRQVFLFHEQATNYVSNYHCVAYTCQSSIDVKLVGNTMNKSSCTLVLSEEGGSLAVFKCEDTITINRLYQSNSNKINITLNMTSSVVKELLWIRVTASNGGLVSVACGSNIPSNATQHCPKSTTTATTTTTTTTTTTATTTTTITTTVIPSSDKDTTVMTQSGTMINPTKESNIPIIGAVVGGLVAVLIVSAISFVVYKKCHKMNKIEDESALATNEDVNFSNPLETPEGRGGWVGSARGTGVVPDSQTGADYTPLPAPFGAALHHMPRPTTSLPPLRHS